MKRQDILDRIEKYRQLEVHQFVAGSAETLTLFDEWCKGHGFDKWKEDLQRCNGMHRDGTQCRVFHRFLDPVDDAKPIYTKFLRCQDHTHAYHSNTP